MRAAAAGGRSGRFSECPVGRTSALPDEQSWFGRGDERRPLVSLLDADAQLGRCVPAAQRQLARHHLTLSVHTVRRGRWAPSVDLASRPLGYVILSGTLIRGLCVEHRWSTEILGPEDVLRPWDEAEQPPDLLVEDTWTALESVRMAILDERFAVAAGRWPQLLDELLSRTVRRSRHLATLLSVSGIRRLDERLLVLLGVLADRWGHVSPERIHVDVRLTHETLARLACAQRPSVSTALARLGRRGLVARKGRKFVLPFAAEPSAR
jgi:CRP/FNR family transcriptional regulator, cyclic AMP receptor protein